MYLWYSKKKRVNVSNPQHKKTVPGSVLCHHDRVILAKSADIWLSGRHVADMSPTFPANFTTVAWPLAWVVGTHAHVIGVSTPMPTYSPHHLRNMGGGIYPDGSAYYTASKGDSIQLPVL